MPADAGARVLIQVLAFAAFLAVLFSLFRYAMGMRYTKVVREAERKAAEAEGRRVVAELPLSSGQVLIFTEAPLHFAWGEHRVAKSDITGVRLRLNGGILAEHTREGIRLPPPSLPDEFEGRETWDVTLYCPEGPLASIPCGTLREGVSREVASTVFAAVQKAIASPGGGPPR